jgi:hypothetical protein
MTKRGTLILNNVLAEVWELIKFMDWDDLNKIPSNLIKFINQNRNKNWKFKTFGMNDKAELTAENLQANVRLTKYRNSVEEKLNMKNDENGEEKPEDKKVEESFKISINDRGWKRTYLPEGYVSQEEFNKLLAESSSINSRDASEIYLIENQYPEYEVITTDTNVFLVKGDKILKFK